MNNMISYRSFNQTDRSKNGSNETFIYQPNRITNAKYGYTLIQEKLFTAIMYFLQEEIRKSMDGHTATQMQIFKETSDDVILIDIPLRHIARPQQYEQVKNAIKQLAGVVVSIPIYDKKSNLNMIRYTGLFRANIPVNRNKCSIIKIEIEKKVAKLLIEIDRNGSNSPVNYTRFIYEVAQKSRSKYSPRLYKLLCSWRKKGELTISIDYLREWLNLKDKYKYYRDIKKFVLIPAQKDLEAKADCWFDCNSDDFVIKEGNVVTQLRFKVITHDRIENDRIMKDHIKQLLRTHFNFKTKDLIPLSSIINDSSKRQDILCKINELNLYLKDKSNIRDRIKYVITSLQEHCSSP